MAAETPQLPPAAQAAAAQILASQAPLGESASAADVQAAARSSGVLLEASLAQLAAQPNTGPGSFATDLKALLLQLSAALAPIANAPVADAPDAPAQLTTPAATPPPPPTPGGALAGQPPAQPTLPPGPSAHQAAQVLVAGAQAALARVQLSQAASVQSGALVFEAPVATPSGAGVAQFEISRDGAGSGAAGAGPAATWRARFSIDAPPSGPVHAELSLSGGRLRVTLMSPSDDARQALQAGQPELTRDLAGGGEAADVAVRFLTGAPAAPAPQTTGRFLDRRT